MADFASLMSGLISKSKPPPTKKDSASPSTSEPKKYLKRSELEAQREATYLAEQAAASKAREEKLQQKRKLEEEEAIRSAARDEKRRKLAEESRIRREAEEEEQEAKRRKRLGLPPLPPKAIEGAEAVPEGLEDISDEELTKKLRALGEPVMLFGESHIARLRRHKALITPKAVLSNGPIPTTLQLLPEAEMAIPSKPPAEGDKEGREYLFRQLASYFTMVLVEWERALAERPEAVKESMQGRQAEGAMVQSRENMRPLFKKFEKGDVEDGILGPVVDIVRAAQRRRYVEANDLYLQLSIGKA